MALVRFVAAKDFVIGDGSVATCLLCLRRSLWMAKDLRLLTRNAIAADLLCACCWNDVAADIEYGGSEVSWKCLRDCGYVAAPTTLES